MILPDSVAIKTVATTPTVYGIETDYKKLPQSFLDLFKLQQHLPFTVLKLYKLSKTVIVICIVATTPTVYGIETMEGGATSRQIKPGCNNTYRLRY